jgi:PAS domain S-box-containing protein
MSNPARWPPAARFAVTFGVTAVAIAISIPCGRLPEPIYTLPLIAAVLACAWLFSLEGGIVSAFAAALATHYLLARPISSSIAFILPALLITWLSALLREVRDRNISILEAMDDALVLTDRRGKITYLNPAAGALIGLDPLLAHKQPFEAVFHLRDETTGETRSQLIPQALQGAGNPQQGAHIILTSRDGTEYSVEESASPVRAADGRITGAILILRNITSRRQLQDQLTQSQKMDAIARLAGGVAGDFNNLLTVITGFAELLTSEMPPGNPLRRFAGEILLAAERAAGLTRQLLAFGKGQGVPAKPHDLNTLIANMETMLTRVLGDRAEGGPKIELVLHTVARNSLIQTDPGQIEQILANLAMNARDAQPDGGRFVLETSEVEIHGGEPGRPPDLPPGPYVMLAVSDSGVGMSAETRSRLFEPFFTTKARGSGSGLGLSIVYGIVKQHGGYISVYSQPGAGTIFEIYFPQVKVTQPLQSTRRLRGPRGTETILIADDEESVRNLVYAVLATSGYTVIQAHNGKEALDLMEINRIDLVLADVMMPFMNGYELGAEIEKRHPGKKILFMSGYLDSHLGDNYDRQRPFLTKPFTPEILLKQVRETLDKATNAKP